MKSKPYRHYLIAACFTGTLIGTTLLLGSGDSRPLRMLGAFFALLALVFFIAPPFILQKHGEIKEGESFLDTQIVVDTGLFAIVRHPQYLGYIFLVITFMLLSQHWLTGIFGLGAVIFFYLHILQEEKYCLARFGGNYQEYMQRVPRLNFVAGIFRLLKRK
jgi:protein-S-isoprenylcysteine O-methyltransferase Ste14